MQNEQKTLIPIKVSTKIRLRTACIDSGRTYDSVITEYLDSVGY